MFTKSSLGNNWNMEAAIFFVFLARILLKAFSSSNFLMTHSVLPTSLLTAFSPASAFSSLLTNRTLGILFGASSGPTLSVNGRQRLALRGFDMLLASLASLALASFSMACSATFSSATPRQITSHWLGPCFTCIINLRFSITSKS